MRPGNTLTGESFLLDKIKQLLCQEYAMERMPVDIPLFSGDKSNILRACSSMT